MKNYLIFCAAPDFNFTTVSKSQIFHTPKLLTSHSNPSEASLKCNPPSAVRVLTIYYCFAHMSSLLASSRPSVGIIGGGISGLSTALSLERLGITCTVFDTGSVCTLLFLFV